VELETAAPRRGLGARVQSRRPVGSPARRCPPAGARHRPAAAWLAWALIVATGGQALALVLFGTGSAAAGVTGRMCQLALLAVLAIVIYRARGNAARLLPEN